MKPPTISEKLRTPAPPNSYLHRPRLVRLWQERRDRRVVLVTAGAGYGKTSFLAARAREEPDAFLWYTADDADAAIATFGGALLELLGSGAALRDGEGDPDDPVLSRRMLHAIIAALRDRGRTILVLDDLHLLQASDPVLRFLEGLIRYVPDNATLILSSREPLDVGAMRARGEGRAATLGARELEFRADEIAALFSLRFGGAKLAPRQCRQVLAATEGWAAGLEIFFQALDAPVPSAVERALEKLLRMGSGWFDYFADEVVRRLDDETREFLLRSSVLPRLDPSVCDDFLRRKDSRRVLGDLVQRNLFTMPDVGLENGFRYHHLFHGFLRTVLDRQTPAREMQRLRLRAARSLLRGGDLAEAADMFAVAGDAETTLQLIERHGAAMLDSGRYISLERALAAVAPAKLNRSPEGLFIQGRILDNLGRWGEAEAAYRKVLRLRPAGGRRAEVQSILGQLLTRRGRHAESLALCRALLRGPGIRKPQVQGRLLAVAGAAACELGRIAEGEGYLVKARALFEQRGDVAGQARIDYVITANVHVPRGDFARGRETARRALASFRKLADPRRTCTSLTVLARVTALAGDGSEARDLATDAWRLAESLGLSQPLNLALVVLGHCALLEGDHVRSREHLEEARQMADRTGESEARILSRLYLGESFLATGDLVAARAASEEALAIARGVKDVLELAQCHALLGRALATKSPGTSRGHLRRAERDFRLLGSSFDLHRLLLLRLGRETMTPPVRRELLGELLSGAARMRHDHLFLLVEPELAARVLADAMRQEIEPGYAAGLLARLGARGVSDILPLTTDPSDDVRLRAVALLAQVGGARARSALAKMTRGEEARPSTRRAVEEVARVPLQPLHIRALGPFHLQVGDKEIPRERWRSGRARRLFQLLLVHRFRWVTGDEVMEALWPEGDPEKTRGNLWQSVYQLRKILEPDLKELRASRYVRVEESGYRLEPGDGSTYDVLDLEVAIQKGDRLSAAGRLRAAEPHYRRGLEMYRGEFLIESPYEDLAVREREHLREMFLRASVRLADSCASARRWTEVVPICRRGLHEDPYNEELQYELVQAHAMLGHRREALDSYQEIESRTSRDLGLTLSARMQALGGRIRSSSGRTPSSR